MINNLIQTTQIVFELTESCNLNCVYCGYGELFQTSAGRNHKNLDIDSAIKLLKYIINLKMKSSRNKLMIGFYGGEPLVNVKSMVRIMDEIGKINSDNKLDISYSMTTNATLIKDNVDFLALNNIYLTISLDGNSFNQSYRIYKHSKKNTFNDVINNIDLICEKYPDYFSNYVNFISVLHDRNSVKEIYDYIYVHYHKIPAIIELNMDGCKVDKKHIMEKMFHSKRKSESDYQNGSSKISLAKYETTFFNELKSFIKHNSINSYLYNKLFLLNMDEKKLPTGTCSPFSLKIFMTTKNELLPCEKINFKYALGKVDDLAR